MQWVTCRLLITSVWFCVFGSWMTASSCLLQMLSFMRAQYTLFQQGYNILDEIDPYMKKLAAQVRAKLDGFSCVLWKMPELASRTLLLFCSLQLDQLVIDSAVEKREMEHKHALIQQRVRELLSADTFCFSSSSANAHPVIKSEQASSVAVRLWDYAKTNSPRI